MTYVNDVSLKVQVDFFFVRCVVRAFPFESGSLGSLVTGHRNPPCPTIPDCPTCPSCPGAAATPATPVSSECSSDKWLSWSVFALVLTLDDCVAEIIHTSYLWRRESRALRPTCVGRLSPDRMGLDAVRAGRRILGVIDQSALTMKESRRVTTFTPDGDVYVEDASGQGREIEGIRWSENRAPGACLRSPTRVRRRSTSPR